MCIYNTIESKIHMVYTLFLLNFIIYIGSEL